MVKLIKEANRYIQLWRKFGPNQAKVDLAVVLNELVLPTTEGDKCEIVYGSFDSFEGIMAKLEDADEWRIGVNTKIQYIPRRNFTLAHEIGHFIGHRYKQSKFQCSIDSLNNFQNAGLEKEANDFASYLLMPADLVRQFDKERCFSHDAVSELAELLGVSRAAVAYRWIELSVRKLGFVISRDEFFHQGRSSEALFADYVFFRQGEEVPPKSLIMQLKSEGEECCSCVGPGIWHPKARCYESSYSTMMGGYVYSYLDFSRTPHHNI